MERRVAITGQAALTPIGSAPTEIFDNLAAGVSGVKPLRDDGLLSRHLHSQVFGAIDYPIDYGFERRYRKTLGPVGYYACWVAGEAIAQAGLEAPQLRSGRVGVAFGSVHGSPTVQRDIYKTLLGPGVGATGRKSRIGAAAYLQSMAHTTAANIARMFEVTGRVISSCTACTTSAQSIGYGYEAIKFGLQDAMICGGADEYDTTTVAVFDALLACSTSFNETPHLTPRPFDRARDGLVVGEAAGAVILEEYEHAKRRGAEILGEVIGFSCSNNGGDLILPSRAGVSQAIRWALQTAKLSPDDVDCISAHATATTMGDVVEAEAIGDVYGARPPVTAFKSYIGHTMASCGVVETIFMLLAMGGDVIFPTLHLDEVDERCAMINHTRSLVERSCRIGAVQNFAFGGVNTCLFVRRGE